MNLILFIFLLTGSIFVASCSTAPTSQSMGKNIGTAMILGGLAYSGKDKKKDANDDSSSDNKKTGVGIALAGLVIHYFIGKSESNVQKRIQEKKVIEQKQKEKIAKQKVVNVEKYYKKEYAVKDIPLFLKYVSRMNYKVQPLYQYEKIKIKGDPILIQVLPEKPYKSTIINTQNLYRNCKLTKSVETKRHYGPASVFIGDIIGKNPYKTTQKNTIYCKSLKSNTLRKRYNLFKSIGVKKNSKLMKAAKSSTFKAVIYKELPMTYETQHYTPSEHLKLNKIARCINKCESIRDKEIYKQCANLSHVSKLFNESPNRKCRSEKYRKSRDCVSSCYQQFPL